MDDRTVAEQAAELARTLPASSTLEVRQGSYHDLAEESRTGFQVLRPDPNGVTYWLNGEEISGDLYHALVPIFEESRQRSTRDPRWQWVDVSTGASHPKTYVKGRCRHIELEPVSGVDADMLFRCGTCGKYLQTVTRRPGL